MGFVALGRAIGRLTLFSLFKNKRERFDLAQVSSSLRSPVLFEQNYSAFFSIANLPR
jgi:hypothetical protein